VECLPWPTAEEAARQAIRALSATQPIS